MRTAGRMGICFGLALTLGSVVEGKQQGIDETGCAELCVRLLCEYYEVDFPQDKVLEILEPGPTGETSLEKLKHCLKAIGFRCRALRGDYDSLMSMEYPMVLYMIAGPMAPEGHFGVVMKNIETGELFAYDPFVSPQPIRVERESLRKRWSGVALEVRPPPRGGNWLGYGLAGLGAFLLGMLVARRRTSRSIPPREADSRSAGTHKA